jgi:glutamate-ammonia-ligase adenylyltransferase
MAGLRERVSELAAIIEANPDALNLARGVLGGSPYLRGLVLEEPSFFAACLTREPAVNLAGIFSELADQAPLAANDQEFMRLIRIAKSRGALLLALADISGAMAIDTVLAGLTDLADLILSLTVNHLLSAAARRGELRLPMAGSPGSGSGYIVLAMGKLGAGELNYSSDIDLIVFFDPRTASLDPGTEPATFFVRLTRRLVAILQEVTRDGYAYRVDLRLRPDPRATQIAISLEAAAVYYENMGQNWERAALIKARPVAGDLALGRQFIHRLEPYLWRRYLDFAAIADVQSLKRQIHAVKGHGEIAVRGHNIKLGRGGIREIEFFVQTQQLIAGGRNADLRGAQTIAMLGALANAGWIAANVADELSDGYRFLRRIENRIQMINDEQTHVLPADPAAFGRLARFAGWHSPAALEQDLRSILERVQVHYSALFENAPALGGEGGSLVFTGGDDDPETLDTLRRLGFRQVSEVSATIRGWHFGRYPAMRSARAKELLTEIMPALLAALARSGDADKGFVAFDRFLSGLSAGIQIFAMLRANPRLLDLIASILGVAPRLADELSHRPKVLDAVLDPGFFTIPLRPEMESLTRPIAAAAPFEETLDRARIIGKEQMFRIGVGVLSELMNAEEAGNAFSDLADCLIGRLLDATRRDLATRYGTVAGESFVILALGKLGGREMTASSDLDLVLIYDTAEDAETSDGNKRLSVIEYFARAGQHLITALASPTSEGSLYSVDMRLRPSGTKGPVATRLSSFISYHQQSAWTWERLALTRARVVAGDSALGSRVEEAVRSALCTAGEHAAMRKDVLDMRRQMFDQSGAPGIWELKHKRGGLIDIEFIVQYLQIANADRYPDILHQNTLTALTLLEGRNLLKSPDARVLRIAGSLYHRLTQVLRLCVAGKFVAHDAPAGLSRLLASACGVPDLRSAEDLLGELQETVTEAFHRLIGPF